MIPSPPVLASAATALGVIAALSAYRRGRRDAYLAGKVAASLGFVATAALVGAGAAGWSRVALAALTLSAAGDAALARRDRGALATGLALFTAAHATFVIAFLLHGAARVPAVLAGTFAALGAAAAWRAVARAAPRALRAPLAVYLALLVALIAAGVGTGAANRQPLLALGAVLVAGSDLAVARERFVTPGLANKLAGLPAYYLGQLALAWSLAPP